ALAGLVLLALGLWLYRGSVFRRSVAVASLAMAVALATLRGQGTNADTDLREGTVAWSPAALEELRNAGTPVFVDVTADWCITCIANEQAVLFTKEMTAEFQASGVIYMVADWTDYDEDIGKFVRSHRRNGIPLYVMYPAAGKGDPFILPQLLTTAMMQEALDRVAGGS
ncbi:MAG: thioredoxin family protein, partial [Halieaceae bacterium]